MRLAGVLFFPVTPFDAAGDLDTDLLARHVADALAHGPGGVFVACGTGEYHALSADEHAAAVAAAVRATRGRVPVVAGAGGSLPAAVACAHRAAEAGADALLLLPPYLVSGPPDGLAGYVEAVADASPLPLVAYQRPGAVFTAGTAARVAAHPKVVGFKDGLGDLDRLQRILLAVRERAGADFPVLNGLPTAEVTMPAYRGLGVRLYSSAVFGFAPEVATAFCRALAEEDEATVTRLLTDFYLPLVRLRDTVPGYAVSLVKAGVRVRGLDVGRVRPPLVDPTPEHVAELERLLAAGLRAVGRA